MASRLLSISKTIVITCTLALSTTAAIAQEVELSAPDGSLSLRGQLVEFDNQKYTIDTLMGRMTVDSNNVLCSGEACPDLNPSSSDVVSPSSEFNIVGLGVMASRLMPGILSSYAQSVGAQVSNTAAESYDLTNTEDEEIIRISLYDTFSSNSLSDLPSTQAAIALTSKPLLPEEIANLNLEQQSDQSSNDDTESISEIDINRNQVVGLNAITIVTAEENPVNAISTSDIAKVFSGEYDNWSDLGGRNASITLYGPQPDSELAKSFEAQIADTQDDEEFQLSQDIFFFDNIAERVAVNPNGIGYTYFKNSEPAKVLDVVGVCGMTTPANNFTIKAEEYPLTQRLYAYRLAQAEAEQADTLLNFMQSDAGQDSVASNGLVNQRDISSSIGDQGIRFANAIIANTNSAESELLGQMVTQIIDSQRLSTTFRFKTGSDQMDERAQADIVRLAEKLQSPGGNGSEVYLIGFTDSVGDFELNQEVSLRRANQVRDALIEADADLAERVSILPAGFGEIAPVACNETARGRSINRRVEVWMSNGS